jgi:peptidoglycan L-alanyl-D-glutamate endopeptidase CwlK
MMTPRDKARLSGVHPDLVAVVEAARQQVPFIVVEGMRTRERQAQLVKSAASRTMDSRHLTGHAVDLAPMIGGTVSWDWPLYHRLAKIVKVAAAQENVPIVWGGDWRTFKDGPHWELPWKQYPKGD